MDGWKRWATSLVSLFIGVILLLQAAMTFRVLCPPARFHLPQLACEPATWPFIHYPMYSDPHFAGEQLPRYSVYGILADHTEVQIAPDDLGITVFQFESYFVPALLNHDRQQVESYATEYETRLGRDLLGLRLENRPLTLSQDGWKEEAPALMTTIALGEENRAQ
jgi:hypothetical protein